MRLVVTQDGIQDGLEGRVFQPESISEACATNQPRGPDNPNWPCHESDRGGDEHRIAEAGESESANTQMWEGREGN